MSKIKEIPVSDMAVKGFTQVRLDVDLADGKFSKTKLSNEFCRDWIGGYGFGAKYCGMNVLLMLIH
ncbi:MAG: hypothetical protein ACFFEN_03775 [Candidatus Thorarchaeota archaeon]